MNNWRMDLWDELNQYRTSHFGADNQQSLSDLAYSFLSGVFVNGNLVVDLITDREVISGNCK